MESEREERILFNVCIQEKMRKERKKGKSKRREWKEGRESALHKVLLTVLLYLLSGSVRITRNF